MKYEPTGWSQIPPLDRELFEIEYLLEKDSLINISEDRGCSDIINHPSIYGYFRESVAPEKRWR